MEPFASPLEKEKYVHAIFEALAPRYDRMNRLITCGLWERWRREVEGAVVVKPGAEVLDVACGTGDFTLIFAQKAGPTGKVVGLDFSREMLARAKEKLSSFPQVRFVEGDALNLPFPAASFDFVFSSFALRNFGNLPRALAEMSRVTRRGGKVVSLELSWPQNPLVALPFSFYFSTLVPLWGHLFTRRQGKHRDSLSLPVSSPPYTYLSRSLRGFPSKEELRKLFQAAGLTEVTFQSFAGGIVALHSGLKP